MKLSSAPSTMLFNGLRFARRLAPLVGVLTTAFCLSAQAQMVIRAPTSVLAEPPVQPFGNTTYTFLHSIDQTALTTNYVSGVTDYELYVAGNPQHVRTTNDPAQYGSTASNTVPPLNIDYDMGATYMIGKVAFWNGPFNSSTGTAAMEIYTSNVPDFSTSTMVRRIAPRNDGGGSVTTVESIDVVDTNARYVRIRITGTLFNNSGAAIGEIAFGTTAPAVFPTPGPVAAASGSVITQGKASTASGAVDAAQFDQIQRSGFLAENGNLAFLGYLKSGTGTVTLTSCSTSPGNPVVTCPNTTGLVAGMPITGTNMPPNATVSSVGPGSFTISAVAIGLGSNLTLTAGTLVDTSNFMGYWKHDGTNVKLVARQGFNAPETGATPAKFNILPLIPGINDFGQVTLFASLLQSGLSNPVTTATNDIGIWSELGETGFQILMRENDVVPNTGGALADSFGYGCFASARTGAGTGEAAFVVGLRGASTDSALVRTSVVNSNTTAVGVIARQGVAAPGAAENFASLDNTVTRSVRMDATGNAVFAAALASGKTGIWYQDQVSKLVSKSILTGEAAPGTTGATFQQLDLPVMGGGGTFSFRGVLNTVGDNVGNDKNDGIWKATGTGAPTLVLRRGDQNNTRPGLFDARYRTPVLFPAIRAGNIYNGWMTNANHGAWLGWVDLGGNGISPYPLNGVFDNNTDTFGIYTDTSGTMTLLVASGDPAPGYAGARFFFIDHPVCGGAEQVAFIGTVTGTGVTPGTNDKGIWRTAANGGVLSLVMRTGDSISVNVNGTTSNKTILHLDIPGSGQADHIWETPVMDAAGRLLVFVTFTDGSTTQMIVP